MAEAAQHPWDRLDGEPAAWFARFDAYRLLGPSRTLVEAWRRDPGLGKERKGKEPGRQWYDASATWRWRERAEAWDAQERPSRQQQQLAELAEARARHREMSRTVQDLAMKAIEKFKAGDLSPVEALKYLEMGADLERKAIEEPLIAEVVRILEEIKKSRRGKK